MRRKIIKWIIIVLFTLLLLSSLGILIMSNSVDKVIDINSLNEINKISKTVNNESIVNDFFHGYSNFFSLLLDKNNTINFILGLFSLFCIIVIITVKKIFK